MLEQDATRKAHRTSGAFSEAIVQMIENVGSAPADRIEDQPLSINRSRTNSGGRSGGRGCSRSGR